MDDVVFAIRGFTRLSKGPLSPMDVEQGYGDDTIVHPRGCGPVPVFVAMVKYHLRNIINRTGILNWLRSTILRSGPLNMLRSRYMLSGVQLAKDARERAVIEALCSPFVSVCQQFGAPRRLNFTAVAGRWPRTRARGPPPLPAAGGPWARRGYAGVPVRETHGQKRRWLRRRAGH
jgi:hypothetical protein